MKTDLERINNLPTSRQIAASWKKSAIAIRNAGNAFVKATVNAEIEVKKLTATLKRLRLPETKPSGCPRYHLPYGSTKKLG